MRQVAHMNPTKSYTTDAISIEFSFFLLDLYIFTSDTEKNKRFPIHTKQANTQQK